MLRFVRTILLAFLLFLGCWGMFNLLGGQKAPLAPEPSYGRIAKTVAVLREGGVPGGAH